MNEYQKKLLLDILSSKVKDLQHNTDKLNQTVKHDEDWAIPFAKRSNSEEVIKHMEDIVTWAKRDIKTNEKESNKQCCTTKAWCCYACWYNDT